MTHLSRQRAAWIAGLIEGEGCIYVGEKQKSISVKMTDEDAVRRIHEWTGIGNVYANEPRGTNRKPFWAWCVGKASDIEWLLDEIGHILCARRKAKAREMAAFLGDRMLDSGEPIDRTAWLAGIIEGEGCLRIAKSKAKGWTTCNVKVAMTDKDTILRVQEWAGVGGVYSWLPKPPRVRVWEWTLTKQEEVLPFVRRIRPLLCARRGRQADAMIRALEEKQANGGFGRGRGRRAMTHCRKGHPLSGDNLAVHSTNGARLCRICENERVKSWREKNPKRARDVMRAAKKRYYAKNADRMRREALARYHARKRETA